MSFIQEIGRRLSATPRPSIAIIVFTALTLGWLQPVLAEIACGDQPEGIATQSRAQLQGDVVIKADLILKAPANAQRRGLVTAQRRELRQKYPDVEKPVLDTYLLWVTCQSIAHDPTLAVSQAFDKYSDFYRLLSEPIDKSAAAAE